MTPDREQINMDHPGRQVGGEPVGEAEHFYVCDDCGQAVDCRNLGDVLYHSLGEHEPIGRAQ